MILCQTQQTQREGRTKLLQIHIKEHSNMMHNQLKELDIVIQKAFKSRYFWQMSKCNSCMG